jgi:hypothetical protein
VNRGPWRIWGKNAGGEDKPIDVALTPNDEIAVRADQGEPVMVPPERAHRLREALAWAVARALRGRGWRK